VSISGVTSIHEPPQFGHPANQRPPSIVAVIEVV
jgi:hypothetical protein